MHSLVSKVLLDSKCLSKGEAYRLIETDVYELFGAAAYVCNHFHEKVIDICSIVSAKVGGCSEDCSFCAQSVVSSAAIKRYPMMSVEKVLDCARVQKANGARRFSVVMSGKRVSTNELEVLAAIVMKIKDIGLLPCVSAGLLRVEEFIYLKKAGLNRYHHNLETSRRYYPNICTTHTYDDKMSTLKAAREAGLSVCCGGIFGIGETWADRIDMAYELKALEVDSVPINFLIPIKGTKLANVQTIKPLEALRIISIYRLIMPEKEIRVCGGRLHVLGDLHPLIFMAGADGLMVGDYLTTFSGRTPKDDVWMIRELGFRCAL